jgi:hypothetical protein
MIMSLLVRSSILVFVKPSLCPSHRASLTEKDLTRAVAPTLIKLAVPQCTIPLLGPANLHATACVLAVPDRYGPVPALIVSASKFKSASGGETLS